jgi:hypothetical protein
MLVGYMFEAQGSSEQYESVHFTNVSDMHARVCVCACVCVCVCARVEES